MIVPDAPLLMFKNFDAVALAICVPIVFFLMRFEFKKNRELLSTISQMVTASRTSALLYGVIMSAVVPLYYAFIYFWVTPLAHMPVWVYGLLIISFICEMVFIWVPPYGKWEWLHTITAGAVFVSMSLYLATLIGSGAISQGLVLATSLGCLVAASVMGYLIVIKNKRWLLWAEVAYCLLFLLALSAYAHTHGV